MRGNPAPLHATSSSKNSPSTSRTGIPAPPSTTSQRLSPGAITGTAIGVLLGALIFAGLAWLVFHYRRKARRLAAAAARHLNSRNRPKDHSGTAATTWVREKAELPGSEAPVGKLMTPFSWPPIFFFFFFFFGPHALRRYLIQHVKGVVRKWSHGRDAIK